MDFIFLRFTFKYYAEFPENKKSDLRFKKI
jgi:hypothetical protein